MPAAYTSGAATSPANALQALVTFLVAQGWTSDHSASEGAGWRAHLHKGSMYVNFRASVNEGGTTIWPISQAGTGYAIHMNAGTGYDSGEPWYGQPGHPQSAGAQAVGVCARLLPGTLASHHFFDDGDDNIVAVFETNAGVFTYLGFGPEFNKGGAAWTGGMYFFASWGHRDGPVAGSIVPGDSVTAVAPFQSITTSALGSTGMSGDARPPARFFIMADVDSFTGGWVSGADPDTDNSGDRSGYTGKAVLSSVNWDGGAGDPAVEGTTDDARIPQMRHLRRRLTSLTNGQAFLVPVPVYVVRDDGNCGLLGWADSVYLAGLSGFTPKDVITLGGRDYMLFRTFAVYKGA